MHRWTVEETELVCKEYVQFYLIDNSNMSTSEFVMNVLRRHSELADIKDESLVMKVSNTKVLVEDLGLGYRDSFPGGSLAHYSQMHKDCMWKVLQKYSLL